MVLPKGVAPTLSTPSADYFTDLLAFFAHRLIRLIRSRTGENVTNSIRSIGSRGKSESVAGDGRFRACRSTSVFGASQACWSRTR